MDNKTTEITADSQVARVFEWRRGFNTIHLIDVGIRVGLFKSLAEAPGVTGKELAERLGLHPPFVETWCKTAYGMELLDADEALRYRLALCATNKSSSLTANTNAALRPLHAGATGVSPSRRRQ